MEPYAEEQVVAFAQDCVAITNDVGMVGVQCARMQRDVDTGSLSYGASRAKHLADLKRAFPNPNPGPGPTPPVPNPFTPPHLEILNNDFVDADGNAICHRGKDQIIAFRMWLDGRTADLEALVAESQKFNFKWWKVQFAGSKAQNTIYDLNPNESNYYDQVRPFATWLNSKGIGLLAIIYVDNQDVLAPLEHWLKMCERFRGTVTIPVGFNEVSKNKSTFGADALQDPGGMIWSRGSDLADVLVPQAGAPVADFHQRTDWPATIMDAVASEVFMESHGYTVCVMSEPTRFDDNSNKSGVPDSVHFARALGLIYEAMWDMVVFHDYFGQRGMLMSPNVQLVAAAWQQSSGK
jgi:hypothetical protein